MTSALALICFMLLAGYAARRFRRFPENAADTLNRFVIDVCVPAMILRLMPQLHPSPSLAVLVIIPWAMALLAFLCARVAGRILGLEPVTATALFLATALGNTSFLGFPMCSALLGETSVPLAAVYDQLGSFLLLSIVGSITLSKATAGARASAGELVRRVILFPPFIALVIALVPWPRPSFVEALLTAASAPLVPLAVFAVGLKLRFSPPRPARVLFLGLALKLVAFPAVAWAIARGFHSPPLVLQVAVLETAMPTMITAGALMMAYGIASELAAAFVSWGLVCSLVTLPIWAFVVQRR